jgi:hypothetical protein
MKHWMSNRDRVAFFTKVLAYYRAVLDVTGYCTPEEMRAAGWQIDTRRDERGRLAV